MKCLLSNIRKKFIQFKGKHRDSRFQVYETGFHGDRYLLAYVDHLMQQVESFVETGTNVGTTTRYMAKTYPKISIFSCEPDQMAFAYAKKSIRGYDQNVYLYYMPSPDFLYQVYDDYPMLIPSLNLYWLDAHGYGFKWPLADEIAFITSRIDRAIIMIDDSEVPGQPQFQFSKYDGQVCNQVYIVNALTPEKTYTLGYPTYTEHTSPHHPLVGWTIIAFGDVQLPGGDNFSFHTLTL